MALGRLSIKIGKVGKALNHACYIAREGRYKKQEEKKHELKYLEYGNLPKFAIDNPMNFWKDADKYERVNGTTYREMELALPRELSLPYQIKLIREWVNQELKGHFFQLALHESDAADGGKNPHIHLMFSERKNDGIEREAEQYFKRYNSKNPAKGGARKGYGANPGKTLTYKERKQELKELRERWEVIVNRYLREYGLTSVRISMKSYKDRGLDIMPEPKQLPSAWRAEGKKNILEYRQAKKDLEKAEIALKVPQIDPFEAKIAAIRERNRKAAAEQAIKDEKFRAQMLEEENKARQNPVITLANNELAQNIEVVKENNKVLIGGKAQDQTEKENYFATKYEEYKDVNISDLQ